MRVTLRFIPSKETMEMELEDGIDGMALMELLKIPPDSHIIARFDRPIPLDEKIRDGDVLTLISVVSGG